MVVRASDRYMRAFYSIGERGIHFWRQAPSTNLHDTGRATALLARMPQVASRSLTASGILVVLALIILAPSVSAVAYVRSLHSARSTGSGVADVLDVRLLSTLSPHAPLKCVRILAFSCSFSKLSRALCGLVLSLSTLLTLRPSIQRSTSVVPRSSPVRYSVLCSPLKPPLVTWRLPRAPNSSRPTSPPPPL